MDCLGELSKVAEKEPQAALVGLTRSLQCEWNFVQRVVKDTSQLFASLEMLEENFLPSSLGTCSVTHSDRVLYSLPVKRGGLGVQNSIEGAELAFSTSRELTDCLVSSILLQDDFDQTLHKTKMREARKNHEEKQNAVDKDKLDELLAVLPADQKRAIRRIIDNNCSFWLTSLPLLKENFDLSATELETLYVSGTENHSNVFSRNAMDVNRILTACTLLQEGRTGNTTTQRNKRRSGRSASILWKDVKREPVVKEPDVENGTPALIADLSARGVWNRQSAASFDIRVTVTDVPSYQNRNPMSVLKTAEIEKKNKYGPASEEKHMSFTPLVTQ